jgi:glycosyltransferase involved in cell wall biosynthesis
MMSLSRRLVRRGHDLNIVVLDDPGAEWLAATEMTVHALGATRSKYGYSSGLHHWLGVHGSDYHRVIVNGLWQYPGLAVWRRFAGTSTPYYVFPHGMLDPWFKRTYPLKHLKKWLYWPWAEYRILRDAAAVVFTSDQERKQARESFWLYRANERISPLGLEPPDPISAEERERFLCHFPQLRNSRVLLFLGRLHPKKGCDLAIEALAATAAADKNLMLVMAGPDQIGWQAELKAMAKGRGIEERIVFTGMLAGEMKRGALGAAEALLLPSHQENFGMAVVEALAVSLPVLISDRINIADEIEADRAGYVAADDQTGTRSLIEKWLATSDAAKAMMRENARECFSRRYHIDRAVDSLLKILSEPVVRHPWR